MTDLWQPNNARTRRVVPDIDLNEVAKAMKDARAIAKPHRLQRPDDGTWSPSPWELRITLAIMVAVIFACFAVAA